MRRGREFPVKNQIFTYKKSQLYLCEAFRKSSVLTPNTTKRFMYFLKHGEIA